MRAAAMGRGRRTKGPLLFSAAVAVCQEHCPQVGPGTSFGRVMQLFWGELISVPTVEL